MDDLTLTALVCCVFYCFLFVAVIARLIYHRFYRNKVIYHVPLKIFFFFILSTATIRCLFFFFAMFFHSSNSYPSLLFFILSILPEILLLISFIIFLQFWLKLFTSIRHLPHLSQSQFKCSFLTLQVGFCIIICGTTFVLFSNKFLSTYPVFRYSTSIVPTSNNLNTFSLFITLENIFISIFLSFQIIFVSLTFITVKFLLSQNTIFPTRETFFANYLNRSDVFLLVIDCILIFKFVINWIQFLHPDPSSHTNDVNGVNYIERSLGWSLLYYVIGEWLFLIILVLFPSLIDVLDHGIQFYITKEKNETATTHTNNSDLNHNNNNTNVNHYFSNNTNHMNNENGTTSIMNGNIYHSLTAPIIGGAFPVISFFSEDNNHTPEFEINNEEEQRQSTLEDFTSHTNLTTLKNHKVNFEDGIIEMSRIQIFSTEGRSYKAILEDKEVVLIQLSDFEPSRTTTTTGGKEIKIKELITRMRALRHVNIIPIFGYTILDDRLCIVRDKLLFHERRAGSWLLLEPLSMESQRDSESSHTESKEKKEEKYVSSKQIKRARKIVKEVSRGMISMHRVGIYHSCLKWNQIYCRIDEGEWRARIGWEGKDEEQRKEEEQLVEEQEEEEGEKRDTRDFGAMVKEMRDWMKGRKRRRAEEEWMEIVMDMCARGEGFKDVLGEINKWEEEKERKRKDKQERKKENGQVSTDRERSLEEEEGL